MDAINFKYTLNIDGTAIFENPEIDFTKFPEIEFTVKDGIVTLDAVKAMLEAMELRSAPVARIKIK